MSKIVLKFLGLKSLKSGEEILVDSSQTIPQNTMGKTLVCEAVVEYLRNKVCIFLMPNSLKNESPRKPSESS